MRKVLIVHAHAEAKSFCSSLKENAKNYFESIGDEVIISDLYQMDFDPVGDRRDFKTLKDPKYFKYQLEQVHAYENDHFSDELKTEMEKLEWCDVLIFNFPLWWFGLPAILKGWVDRVFAMGFVYGAGKGVYENGAFKQKTALVIMTTGGPNKAYGQGKNGELDKILFPIHHGMFYFTGMTVLPPFISFGPARATNEERKKDLQDHITYLVKLNEHIPLYTNR